MPGRVTAPGKGMDFLNEQDIYSKIVDPAITRIKAEMVPALQAALQETLRAAFVQLGEQLDKSVAQVQEAGAALVGRLDGATLTLMKAEQITITIPELTVTLKIPEKKETP